MVDEPEAPRGGATESEAARDARLMALAIDAARRGRPSPNPHVGAVISDPEGRVIATGHHERAGLAHAEVDAIARADRTRGMTLHVTLEPCNHHGRTGPCTEAILAAGFRRVVVGARDPAPHVPGAIDRLRANGVEVHHGVLRRECEELVADFAKHIRTKIPYVVLKAAVTLDGRMATRTGDSKWITGELARTEAHRLRDRADGVLVGVGTVLADDPQLNVRHVPGVDPVRIVLDRRLRTPHTAKVLTAAGGECWILHGSSAPAERRAILRDAGATLLEVPESGSDDEPMLVMEDVLRALGEREIVRLLVEGGPRVHGTILDRGLADRAEIFVAPRIVGDREAMGLAEGRGSTRMAEAWRIDEPSVRRLGDDIWVSGELARERAQREEED